MPTLSWSALYVANYAFSHPWRRLAMVLALPCALFTTASQARQLLQVHRTWYSTPLMTPSSNPPRSR
jgi:hypothetical protein